MVCSIWPNFIVILLISGKPDVVMQYCFGQMDHRVEADGFDPGFHHTSFSAGTMNALMRHMNWIMQIMRTLPESWAVHTGPEMASFVVLKRVSHHILCSLVN
jgi:hypothetical protein